ncbi:MAG: hypothetical protein OEY22_06685 [Candidatus Bathyarchaeota archaeon]|nr:hypothetical protein [Candidatus Bathyarchaeota archaeon]MDH5787593.1 hypothetical protein [Candidatus Bathyarchaeota archaeon]
MSWKDLMYLGVIILGVILFLYGANYYDGTVGWAGVYLAIAGFLAGIGLQVYELLKKFLLKRRE